MNKNLDETLSLAATKAVEEWAFLFTGGEAAPLPPDTVFLEATVDFSGPRENGRLGILAPGTWSSLLRAGVLGEDPDLSQPDPETFGELLNIILGHFLALRHGPGERFDRTIPSVLETRTERMTQVRSLPSCELVTDGTPVVLYFISGKV